MAGAGRILVVDDTAVPRMLVAEILRQAGYSVREATSGAEALGFVDAELPDLVLLDVQMPGMSGYDVCRRLKAMPRTREVPVVFISALDEINQKVQGFEAGGADYVTKPFEPAEVLARIGNQVHLSRLQRELRERNLELQHRNEQLVLSQQRTEKVFVALSEALPGTVLDDTYRLDTRIGEGGFGAVFSGMHLRLRRPVAIKVLRPEGSDPSDLIRFKREGIAACRITHPNAVEVIDFGVSSNGIAYLVMELLSGRTLNTLLDEQRVLPLSRCAEIAVPICEALAAAHAAGIVHRDIKPHNIFLHTAGGREVVKVVDFGIAKLMDQPAFDPEATGSTQRGLLIGTPEYMAPERLLGQPYDERSDIYSVGVLLYLMLSGVMPFEGPGAPTMMEMVRLHSTAHPRPLSESAPQVPLPLAAVVMDALSRDPAGRPTLGAIAEALGR